MTPALLALLVQETPAAIALIQSLFAQRNPGVPVPTSAEIIAGYVTLYTSDLGKDVVWLAANPAA